MSNPDTIKRKPDMIDPLRKFLDRQDALILDGGLATALEAKGHDLSDPLWSARLLRDDPEAIVQVHLDYLRGGADCIISSSYQASIEGFVHRGSTRDQAIDLLRRSTALAVEARDRFWSDPSSRSDRLPPLVAASIGPYGACLADGSEYTGDYDLDEIGLRDFHGERLEILAGSGADLLACETIPSLLECDALIELLSTTAGPPAWMSFSCRDAIHLNDGSPFIEAVRHCTVAHRVVAVGINCTSPEHIEGLLSEALGVTRKPILLYPNSGEGYDAVRKSWISGPSAVEWEKTPREWLRQGASAIGGCCRVGPQQIRVLRRGLGI